MPGSDGPGPSDRPGGPAGRDDPDDGTDEARDRGLLGALRRLANALVDVDAGTGSGRVVGEGETDRFEYRFGVSTIEDLLDESGSGGRSRSAGRGGGSELDAGAERDQYGRIDAPTSVYEGTEGVVVHVDLPEVEGDTVAAGVDGRTFVVGVGEEVLTRVDLPREGLEVQHGTYNHGVLEFFLRDGETAGDDRGAEGADRS